MTRKSISTSHVPVACTICGRTLLRGETADVFLHGGSRRSVCELCVGRAVHEGWIREGIDGELSRPPREGSARGLLTRLRTRRESLPRRSREEPTAPPPEVFPEDDWEYELPQEPEPAYAHEPVAEPAPPAPVEVVPPQAAVATPPEPAAEPADPFTDAFQQQIPRNVHAVPTNAGLKVARALEVFNASQHPRTVAGVARSLGAPMVSARPSLTEGSIVTIVVGWELSWYRYEIDLGDEAAGVRLIGQGAELDELEERERESNAVADEAGRLHPAADVA